MSGPKRGRLSAGRSRPSSNRGRPLTSRSGQGPPHPTRNPNEPTSQLLRPQQGQFDGGFLVPVPVSFSHPVVQMPYGPVVQMPLVFPPPNASQLQHLPSHGVIGYPGPGGIMPSNINRPRSASAPDAMPRSHPLHWHECMYYPAGTLPPVNSMQRQHHPSRQGHPGSATNHNQLQEWIGQHLQLPAPSSEWLPAHNPDVDSPSPPPFNPMLGRLQEHATAQHRYRMTNPNSHLPPNFDSVTMAHRQSIAENGEPNMLLFNDRPCRIRPVILPRREDFNRCNFKQVKAIIKRNDLKDSPEDIYYAVVHWIDACQDRRQYLRELLLHVRMIFLPNEFLQRVVLRHPLVKKGGRCHTDVLNAVRYRQLLQPERTRIRMARTFPSYWLEPDTRVFDEEVCEKRISFDRPKRIYVLGGNSDQWRGGASARTRTFEFFDCDDKTWNMGGDMPVMSDTFGAASYRNTIWIVGGEERIGEGQDAVNRLTNAAYFYTPSRDLWSVGPPMKKKRSNLGLIEYNGCLYAIGGRSETEAYEKSVEVVTSPNNLSWTDGVDMNTGRIDMGVAVVSSRIYVVGGAQNSNKNQMEYFCCETQQWTYVNIQIPRCDYRRITVDDELVYLLGGNDLRTCNVYNPACGNRGWMPLPRPDTEVCLRMNSSIAAVDGVIYYIGGVDQDAVVENVSVYVASTGMWTHEHSSCTSKRANAKAVVLKVR